MSFIVEKTKCKVRMEKFIYFSIQMCTTPDGLVKLEIEHAKPSDCGAYKLVISNPNGDVSALCAVAVKRNLIER